MTKSILALIVIVALSGCSLAVLNRSEHKPYESTLQSMAQRDNNTTISISSTELSVGIVDTPKERSRGLSGVETLAENEGLLFVFADAAPRGFWMKDMHFPLDMIWIRDKIIVGISRDVPVMENGDTARRSSGEPADMVLEVNAGWSHRHGVDVGDTIERIE